MNPVVSFIVATHHRPNHLARAIASLSILGPLVEVIVVADEGSNESRNVAAERLRATDTFVSRPGMRGPAESRNIGVGFARGDWICFLDDDDSVAPNYLDLIRPHLHGGDIIYSNFEKVHDNEDLTFSPKARMFIGAKSITGLEIANFIPIGSFFVPRHIASSVSFDPHLPAFEDWDYLLQLRRQSAFRHVKIRGFRYHQSGGPSRNKASRRDRCIDFLSIYHRHPASSEEIERGRREKLDKIDYLNSLRWD